MNEVKKTPLLTSNSRLSWSKTMLLMNKDVVTNKDNKLKNLSDVW